MKSIKTISVFLVTIALLLSYRRYKSEPLFMGFRSYDFVQEAAWPNGGSRFSEAENGLGYLNIGNYMVDSMEVELALSYDYGYLGGVFVNVRFEDTTEFETKYVQNRVFNTNRVAYWKHIGSCMGSSSCIREEPTTVCYLWMDNRLMGRHFLEND